jgi:hypothetical protein
MLDYIYCSEQTTSDKLDGLKVWPDDSELVEFSHQGWLAYKSKQPTLWNGPKSK